eukprot:scaffold34289_cov73-Isochrysis_galbana.AAC.1
MPRLGPVELVPAHRAWLQAYGRLPLPLRRAAAAAADNHGHNLHPIKKTCKTLKYPACPVH